VIGSIRAQLSWWPRDRLKGDEEFCRSLGGVVMARDVDELPPMPTRLSSSSPVFAAETGWIGLPPPELSIDGLGPECGRNHFGLIVIADLDRAEVVRVFVCGTGTTGGSWRRWIGVGAVLCLLGSDLVGSAVSLRSRPVFTVAAGRLASGSGAGSGMVGAADCLKVMLLGGTGCAPGILESGAVNSKSTKSTSAAIAADRWALLDRLLVPGAPARASRPVSGGSRSGPRRG
jgi:hypothetical protein